LELLDDLNIAKYGFDHLAEKRPVDFTPDEIEQALDIFDKEDVAPPVFDATVNPGRIDELLSRSHCRKCGKCCQPDPRNPTYPGVEIVEDELKKISKHYRISHKAVKKGTKKGGQIKNPDPPYEVLNTKWLTLPCMFYDLKKKQCGVHELRPVVCKIYPLVFHHSIISLKVNCEYGKDLYRSLMEEMRSKKQLKNESKIKLGNDKS
jgi:Fe-S-cluster containining protein